MQPSCSSLSPAEFHRLFEVFDQLIHKPQASKLNDFCTQHFYFTENVYRRIVRKRARSKLDTKGTRSTNRIRRRVNASQKLVGNHKRQREDGQKPERVEWNESQCGSYSSSYCLNSMSGMGSRQLTVQNNPSQLNTQQVQVLQMPEEQMEDDLHHSRQDSPIPQPLEATANQQFQSVLMAGWEIGVEQVRMQIENLNF